MSKKEASYHPKEGVEASPTQGAGTKDIGTCLDESQLLILYAQMVQAILAEPDIHKSIPSSLGTLSSLLQCQSVALYQNGFDPENNLFARRVHHTQSNTTSSIYDSIRYADHGTLLQPLMEGVIINKTVSDIRNVAFQNFWQRQGIRSILMVPIILQNDCWGYLQAVDLEKEHTWNNAAVEMIRAVADLIREGLIRAGRKGLSIERKERYQALVIQEVREAIISMDLDHRIISWNKGAEEIYGVKEAQMIGKTFFEVFHHQYIGVERTEVFRILNEQGTFAGEFFFTTTDGQKKYLECTISFITDPQRHRIGVVGIHRDITAKKNSDDALQKNELRHSAIINALSEGVILLNEQGKLISANQSALQIFDTDLETLQNADPEIYSMHLFKEDGSLFPMVDFPAIYTLKTGLSRKSVVMGFERQDKSITWISMNTKPVYYTNERSRPDAVVLSFVDVTAMRESAQALEIQSNLLAEHAQHMQSVLDSITDEFFALDRTMHVLLWNKVFEQKTGIPAAAAIGKPIDQLLPEITAALMPHFIESLQNNAVLIEEFFQKSDELWYEVRAYPNAQGLFISFREITQRKLEETLIALEKEVLELHATSAGSLKQTLEHYFQGLEALFSGMYCAVIQYHEEDNNMEVIAGPRLPDIYKTAVNGMQIGPKAGSCGTAIFLKEPVLITDITKSPLWNYFGNLAELMPFRSSWAYPILSSNNHVLGTFAVFQKQQGLPNAEQVKMIERALQLLKPIMEHKLYEEKIKSSNERYLLATMATHDAIWDVDLTTKLIYWAEGFNALFGYRAGTFKESERSWENALHPQDLERVETSINAFIDSKSHEIWQEEYRFKRADGRYVLVVDRGFLIFDAQGSVTRMVGAMQDITEKRELENKLIRQEVNRHKFVTQAVVDAQEKERSEIGKELHDNVNQILSTAKLYLEVARNKPPDLEKILTMSVQYISVAINEIRAISKSLVPSSIGDLGLIESVKDLIEGVRLTKALNIEFTYDKDVDRILGQQQKLMLFRIIQEQMNNVLRHAHAASFSIDMIYEDGQLQLVMTDDGIGFDPEDIKHKKGVGLFNINSRVELFNGKAEIFSSPGAGCTIMIQFPI